jgi:hypothetical protein
MPFKSYEQMAYLKHNEPVIYKRWKRKYGMAIVKSKAKKRRTKND